MEKIHILNIYLMILRRRIQAISNVNKIMIFFVFLLLYSTFIFIIYNILNIFPRDFSLNLAFWGFIVINFLILPYMLKKIFYISFETNDKSLIYTFPIKKSTIIFINHTFICLYIFIFYFLLYLPILISLGIIFDFQYYSYMLIILLMILMISITFVFVELVFLLLMFIFPRDNKRDYLVLFSRFLVVLYFITVTYISNNINIILDSNLFSLLKNTYFLDAKNVYVMFNSIIEEDYILFSLNLLCSFGIFILFFIINRFLWERIYNSGTFISNGSNKIRKNFVTYSIEKVVKMIDKLIFKDQTLFFQKDVFFFFRNIFSKLELILTPLAFTSITYFVNFKNKGVLGVSYIIVLFLLWSTINLALDSVKSEGGMLLIIKKSSPLSSREVIRGKICAIRLILFIVCTIYLSVICFFGISFSDLITLIIVAISVLTLATTISLAYSFIYSETDGDKVKIKVKGELKIYFLYLILVIPIASIVYLINCVIQFIILKIIFLILTVVIVKWFSNCMLNFIVKKN